MKATFEVLKERTRILVVLTRDSVCAGDDCDAPHEKAIEAYSMLNPAAFAEDLSSGYLPSVAGSGHSWTCLLNSTKIAEISNKSIRALVAETPFEESNRVHFKYHSSTW